MVVEGGGARDASAELAYEATQRASSVQVQTPAEALHFDEVRRIRTLGAMVVLVTVTGAPISLLVGGDPIARMVSLTLLIGLGVVGLVAFWSARDVTTYRHSAGAVLAITASFTLIAIMYFWGVYSSAVLFIPILIYFFALGSDRPLALATFAIPTLGHAAFGVLTATGAIIDRGVVSPELPPLVQVVVVLIAQIAFAVTYVMARAQRRSTSNVLQRLDQAARGVAQRDIALKEARLEIERALQIGGAGRYTDQSFGSYRLGVVIGRGAMGEVYEASHVDTGAIAAVKFLYPHLLASSNHVARFLREAAAAQSLDSPNVVRIIELGSVGDALPYLVMERLRGHDLGHYLRADRQFSVERVVNLVSQVGRGLDAAAAAGIVHRDIKPQNLFLHKGERGPATWKILDFGLAKLLQHHSTLTHGDVIGTPAYMAPEQAGGKDLDHRADLYSLAAVAYRALTGHPPFERNELAALLHAVINAMPTQPRTLASVPEDVECVLALALAKRPEDRFDTCGEFARALAAAGAGQLERPVVERAKSALKRLPWGAAR